MAKRKAAKKKTARKKTAKKKTVRKANGRPVIRPFTTPAEQEYRKKLATLKPERLRRFVENYVAEPNGEHAAAEAGYSAKTARFKASQLLTKINVMAVVEAGFLANRERSQVTREMIQAEYVKIGFANIKNYLSFDCTGVVIRDSKDIEEEKLAGLSEVTETRTQHGGTIKVKMGDKKGALDSLCRMNGLFIDKLDLTKHPHEQALSELE